MGTWFPKAYDTLMESLERRRFGEIRKKLIDKAIGNVLEIGSGTGLNFPFYERAAMVTAIEPDPLIDSDRWREPSMLEIQLKLFPLFKNG